MRRRLLTSTLVAVGVAVVLLGLPLALAVRGLLTTRALDDLQAQTELLQVSLNAQAASPDAQRGFLGAAALQTGSRFTLFDARGAGFSLIDTGGPPEVPTAFDADLERAVLGSVGRVRGEGLLAVSLPVRAGGVTQILRAVRPDDQLRAELRSAWGQLVLLAVVALAVGALAAGWQSRRLARPLEDLAGSARRLGEGDFTARAPRSGLPEADDVALALDTTATRLAALVERSAEFSADASHQLRTPLTALRLHLEALELAAAGGRVEPADVEAALGEADRLEAIIEDLLTLARAPAGSEHLDVERLVLDRIAMWRELARAQGREVVVQSVPVPPVRARAAAIGQALQVLLDNALEYGEGVVSVAVGPVRGAAVSHSGVRLAVADEGGGVREEERQALFTSSGRRGLPLARSLVEAEGGRLRVERASPPVFALHLPAVDTGAGVDAAPVGTLRGAPR